MKFLPRDLESGGSNESNNTTVIQGTSNLWFSFTIQSNALTAHLHKMSHSMFSKPSEICAENTNECKLSIRIGEKLFIDISLSFSVFTFTDLESLPNILAKNYSVMRTLDQSLQGMLLLTFWLTITSNRIVSRIFHILLLVYSFH